MLATMPSRSTATSGWSTPEYLPAGRRWGFSFRSPLRAASAPMAARSSPGRRATSQCQAAWRAAPSATASSMAAEQLDQASGARTPFWVSSRLAPVPSLQADSRTAATFREAFRASASSSRAHPMRCSGVRASTDGSKRLGRSSVPSGAAWRSQGSSSPRALSSQAWAKRPRKSTAARSVVVARPVRKPLPPLRMTRTPRPPRLLVVRSSRAPFCTLALRLRDTETKASAPSAPRLRACRMPSWRRDSRASGMNVRNGSVISGFLLEGRAQNHQRAGIESHEGDGLRKVVGRQPGAAGGHGDGGGPVGGEPVDARADGREGHTAAAVSLGQLEARPVAGGEGLVLTLLPAVPDRAHRMDDEAGRHAMAAGQLRLSRRAAPQAPAFLQQARSRRAVDGPVHAAAAQQVAVRGVDDGVHGEGGDVGLHHLQAPGGQITLGRGSAVPPTTRAGQRMGGRASLTGTPWPSLPQVPMSKWWRSFPMRVRPFSTSGPQPLRVAFFTGYLGSPFSTQ